MNVLVANQQRRVRVAVPLLRRAALGALRREGCPRGTELSIVVVDDATIRALNRRYRHRDRPTDVLAFPQGGGPGGLLGDVVISADRAAAQAPAYGSDVDRELQLLVVHGVLHLLGYDDTNARAAARMRRRQEEILRALRRGRSTRR